MFNINFISEPGLKDENSNDSWSFLKEKKELKIDEESTTNKPKKSFIKYDAWKNYVFVKKSFIKYDAWKNYVFVMISLGLIIFMSILNTRYSQVNHNLVLNQIIDLIIESDYAKNFDLQEIQFNQDKINVILRSNEILTIQELMKKNDLSINMTSKIYKKGLFNYLDILFPWNGNKNGGDILVVESMIDNIVFSNDIFINQTDDIFEFQGVLSDVVTFLLHMTEIQQIQKFHISVSHHKSGNYNVILDLNLL